MEKIDIIEIVGPRENSDLLCRRLVVGDIISLFGDEHTTNYKIKMTYSTGIGSEHEAFENIMKKLELQGMACKCSGWIYDNPIRFLVVSVDDPSTEKHIIDPSEVDSLCRYCTKCVSLTELTIADKHEQAFSNFLVYTAREYD